jgi:hypothetical protein
MSLPIKNLVIPRLAAGRSGGPKLTLITSRLSLGHPDKPGDDEFGVAGW